MCSCSLQYSWSTLLLSPASEYKAVFCLCSVCVCVCVFSRVRGVWPFTFQMGLRRIALPLGQWNRRWAAVPVLPAPLSHCHWDSHRTSTTSRHRPTAAPRVMATLTLSLVSACYHPFPTHTRSCMDQSAYICSIFTTVGMLLAWGNGGSEGTVQQIGKKWK